MDDLAESSDDSDFRIEDHFEEETDDSLDSDTSSISGDGNRKNKGKVNYETDEDSNIQNGFPEIENKPVINHEVDENIIKSNLVCSVCLGDRSDDTNEIIECDGCGVSVHEACYGIQENISLASTASSCSTEPWFCEACRAGVSNPNCELCPNTGGIFKETDVGKWVHLVCALYTPNVKFGEVEALSNVTLFELPYTRWGGKPCHLCHDQRFVRTGITIGCDAGMCRTYFHVTCGQREGLLSDTPPAEEFVQADPFFAHCKLHSDRSYMRKKKRNWMALQLRMQVMGSKRDQEGLSKASSWCRNQRKLTHYKQSYTKMKTNRNEPLLPTMKIPRLLTTSASACRALWLKSELMGFDITSFEETEVMITSLRDIPKKWNIPPAFSVEFIGYFLDRDSRLKRLKKQLTDLSEDNERLINEQKLFQDNYNLVESENTEVTNINNSLRKQVQIYYGFVSTVTPNAMLPDIENLGQPKVSLPFPVLNVAHPLASTKGPVPTAAALKAGVGFPIRLQKRSVPSSIKTDSVQIELNNKCNICHKYNEPHLLTKCDTCKHYYHLGCLIPPLTRMPKKTKQMGWQCSECDNNASSSDPELMDTNAPRKLRHVNADHEFKTIPFVENSDVSESLAVENHSELVDIQQEADLMLETAAGRKSNKKRRREKHRNRYSPELIPSSISKHHSRKRKHKSIILNEAPESDAPRQGIKLFIKSVRNPNGPANCTSQLLSSTSTFVAKTEEYITNAATSTSASKQKTTKIVENQCDRCDTCNNIGTNLNMVKCDECMKCFHFGCLDPPVKKSPKVRGYSWHCANCDPTESDSN